MRVHAWDATFVRARRSDVHPLVRAVATHPRWWPRLRVSHLGGGWLRVVHRPGRWGPRLTVEARVTTDRPADKGLHLAYRGDFDGRAEWYYLDEVDGTVVHHVLDADTRARGAARRVARYRASVRAAMHELKDVLEAGRRVGDEPDPALLAHQREAARALLPPATARDSRSASGSRPDERDSRSASGSRPDERDSSSASGSRPG